MPKAQTKGTKKTTARSAAKPVVTPAAYVSPIMAVKNYWTRYIDLMGKSTRAEYWWAWLFVLLLNIVTMCVVVISGLGILSSLVFAVTFIPSRALAFRRFRDAGLSGWLYLIPVLVLLIWAVVRSDTWLFMANLEFLAPDMAAWSLLWMMFSFFCLVVFCLPSRKK